MNVLNVIHDNSRWPARRAAGEGRPRCIQVLALIRKLAEVDERALPDAAAVVIERIKGCNLYVLSQATDAVLVDSTARWSLTWRNGDGPIVSFWETQTSGKAAYGMSGAVEWMREHWVREPEGYGSSGAVVGAGWDDDQGAPLAILESDAVALFPELCDASAAASDSAPVQRTSASDAASLRLVESLPPEPEQDNIIQPDGGKWPHTRGAAWTDAEREALFLMRHLHKLAGKELAEIAGVSRQALDEQIGPARPPSKGLSSITAKCGWTPSAELIARCGRPLQPLQNMVVSLGSR
jgi:hypothetical protein